MGTLQNCITFSSVPFVELTASGDSLVALVWRRGCGILVSTKASLWQLALPTSVDHLKPSSDQSEPTSDYFEYRDGTSRHTNRSLENTSDKTLVHILINLRVYFQKLLLKKKTNKKTEICFTTSTWVISPNCQKHCLFDLTFTSVVSANRKPSATSEYDL